jgi:uncharacterized membrane protein
MAGATAAVAWLHLRLPVVGSLAGGLPGPALGTLGGSDAGALLPAAVGIAIVTFADTGVLSHTLAAVDGEEPHDSREMTALGITNFAVGVLGGFPVSGSASRTPVARESGARSRLTGAFAGLAVAALVVAAPARPGSCRRRPSPPWSSPPPSPSPTRLGSPACAGSGPQFALALVASAGVAAFGVLRGIAVAVGLSLMEFVTHAWRPYMTELGRADGRKGYHDLERHPEARRIPGLVIARFDAPLFFANASVFAAFIRRLVDRAPERVRWVVLAAEPVTDVDTTAAEALVVLDEELGRRGVRLLFAEIKQQRRRRPRPAGRRQADAVPRGVAGPDLDGDVAARQGAVPPGLVRKPSSAAGPRTDDGPIRLGESVGLLLGAFGVGRPVEFALNCRRHGRVRLERHMRRSAARRLTMARLSPPTGTRWPISQPASPSNVTGRGAAGDGSVRHAHAFSRAPSPRGLPRLDRGRRRMQEPVGEVGQGPGSRQLFRSTVAASCDADNGQPWHTVSGADGTSPRTLRRRTLWRPRGPVFTPRSASPEPKDAGDRPKVSTAGWAVGPTIGTNRRRLAQGRRQTMEISKLFGLPAHPLLVHVPVVLVPLGAVGALLILIRPAWRGRFGVLVAITAGVGLAGLQFAIGSGESLEERVQETPAVERHAELAGISRLSVLVFFLAVTAFVLYDRRRRSRAVLAGPGTPAAASGSALLLALAALTVVTSLLATASVVQAGHSGAKAVWERTSDGQRSSEGGGEAR